MTKQERRRERPLITRIDAKKFSCRKLICVNLRHSRANLLSVSSAGFFSLQSSSVSAKRMHAGRGTQDAAIVCRIILYQACSR